LINYYSYIIAARQAAVEMQANQQAWASQDFVKTPEYTQLQSALRTGGQTLYELENQLAALVEQGKL